MVWAHDAAKLRELVKDPRARRAAETYEQACRVAEVLDEVLGGAVVPTFIAGELCFDLTEWGELRAAGGGLTG